MLLLSAVALLLSGAALIVYFTRERRDIMAARVAMVRPGTQRTSTEGARAAGAASFYFAHRAASAELREVARLLARLHLPPPWAPAVLVMLGVIAAAIAGVLGWLASLRVAVLAASPIVGLGLALGLAIIGWFAVPWLLRRRVKKRVATIEAGLPDAIELLVVCVEAGLALGDGLDRVVAELGPSRPEVAAELALTSADLKILPSRDEAFLNFADRVDLASVRSVVTTLSQTMRYGTPLAQALRIVASDLRDDSLLRLEERASKLPVLLTVPMMLFIMPTIFLIVGGPAALRVIDVFYH